jgi:hypothetical protein
MAGLDTFLEVLEEVMGAGRPMPPLFLLDVEQVRLFAARGRPEYVILAGDLRASTLGAVPVCFTLAQTLIGVRGEYKGDRLRLETLSAAPVSFSDIKSEDFSSKEAESPPESRAYGSPAERSYLQ